MGQRIPASEQTHQRLEQLLKEGVGDGDARAELIKLAVRKIVEEALEAEVSEAVGRGYYESGATPGAGYRNGYRPRAPEDRRGPDRIRRPAGRGSGRAIRVADPDGASRPNGRAGAPGR
jgi:transposase-like protein